MATMVGMQNDFSSALKNLVELEYDTVEDYETAINRLSNDNYKKKLGEFLQDHYNHILGLLRLYFLYNFNAVKNFF